MKDMSKANNKYWLGQKMKVKSNGEIKKINALFLSELGIQLENGHWYKESELEIYKEPLKYQVYDSVIAYGKIAEVIAVKPESDKPYQLNNKVWYTEDEIDSLYHRLSDNEL